MRIVKRQRTYRVEVTFAIGWRVDDVRRTIAVVRARSTTDAEARAKNGLPAVAYQRPIQTRILEVLLILFAVAILPVNSTASLRPQGPGHHGSELQSRCAGPTSSSTTAVLS